MPLPFLSITDKEKYDVDVIVGPLTALASLMKFMLTITQDESCQHREETGH